ncbi:MAG: cell division protein FtsB [Wenzhouxiangella sp.]|nr:cell division protein FtsB [Wenzhouxiangella sp.]
MRMIVAVLVVLLVALQFQLWQEWQHVRELDARVVEQQQRNAELKARNDALFAEVQDLREGVDAIEERARSELGLVGEDESFYLIVDPALASPALDASDQGISDQGIDDQDMGEQDMGDPTRPDQSTSEPSTTASPAAQTLDGDSEAKDTPADPEP